MIIWRGYGNLLDDKEVVQCCPINAVGAMGKGLALTMRRAYPGLYEAYRDIYHPQFSPVKDIIKRAERLEVVDVADIRVLLFCTKYHWRHRSSLELIDRNLQNLAAMYEHFKIKTLAMPMIGTGEGRQSRRTIEFMIEHHLGKSCSLPVKLYLGPGT